MPIYKGEVVASSDEDFPYAAVISDDTGKVVGEFPVRTIADGEAKIVEVIADLQKAAADDSNA